MAHRFALIAAALAAIAVLASAMALAGFAPVRPAPTPAATTPDAVDAAVADSLAAAAAQTAPPTPAATTQVDNVYVEPAPAPKTVRIVKRAPTRPATGTAKPAPTLAPIIIHRVIPAPRSIGEAGDGQNGDD
jgi:hypothetical protein